MKIDVKDTELMEELHRAYEYAAPFTAHTRFAIAYLSRPELMWSVRGDWVFDRITGEIALDADTYQILPDLEA